jgi:hypothetical protein
MMSVEGSLLNTSSRSSRSSLSLCRGDFFATVKVVQFSAVAGQAVPAQAAPPGSALLRSSTEWQALRLVVLFDQQSYALGVEVRMGNDTGDLQITARG